tara:strand:+ start:1404 stop:1712 length:309 start_codon:yes stop_codon:yes gene_type:complete
MSTQNSNSAHTAPVKTFRDRAISVRVWKKEHKDAETGKTNIFYSIDMKRGYKSGDIWKNTSSINGRDALRVSNLFTHANNWIVQQQYSIPAQTDTAAQESSQ